MTHQMCCKGGSATITEWPLLDKGICVKTTIRQITPNTTNDLGIISYPTMGILIDSRKDLKYITLLDLLELVGHIWFITRYLEDAYIMLQITDLRHKYQNN